MLSIEKKTKETDTVANQEPPTIVLELALYKNYTWGKTTYVAGQPYRFTQDVALRLLAETDTGRQVWKQYVSKPVKKLTRPVVADATRIEAPTPIEDPGGLPDKSRRIDVGTDDEIADILNRQDSDEDVTV